MSLTFENSRNILLNSFTPYAFTFLPPSLFLTTFFHRPRNTVPLCPDRYGANYSSDIVDLYFSVQFRKRFLNQLCNRFASSMQAD